MADPMLVSSRQPSLTGSQQQQALLAMYPSGQAVQQPLIEVAGQQQPNNELIGYYFGSISRETAEWILKTHGNEMDGAYLLRSSGSNDDFVLSLMVANNQNSTIVPLGQSASVGGGGGGDNLEVLHYKIVETEDSFVALHGQVGDEKFATIDELIEKAQGVATKPRWPINRQSLESQILPPTYWGLSVDQIRLAILLKAKQWGFPLLSPAFQQQQQQPDSANVPMTETAAAAPNATTLNNETIRTLIYKSLHEFQPWFHGKISREEAERRIEEGPPRDGRFLVRERDNYSYAMCISHKKTTKHYRIDVLPTGELAIQDGRKFTSLMALVSHYTIMSDGLWCALTEACPRPIQQQQQQQQAPIGVTSNANRNGYTLSDIGGVPSNLTGNNIFSTTSNQLAHVRIPSSDQHGATVMNQNNLYCVPPIAGNAVNGMHQHQMMLPTNHINAGPSSSIEQHAPKPLESAPNNIQSQSSFTMDGTGKFKAACGPTTKSQQQTSSLICSHHSAGVTSIKAPIKEWLQTINHKWSQLLAAKSQHQTLNSFLFGNQNPLNNHCRHSHHHRANQHHMSHRRKCKNGHTSCGCIQQMIIANCAPASTLNQTVGLNGSGQLAGSARLKDQEVWPAKVQSCCSLALCPATMMNARQQQPGAATSLLPQHLVLQNNLPLGDLSACAALNATNNSMPKSSGFTLSGQSYVGSSLFAVKPSQRGSAKGQQEVGGQQSGSSNSDSGTSLEEKLISPAESSANLNNVYSTDIYGSQSTAIVNDRLPATSSSSSSGTNVLVQQRGLPNGNGAHKFKPAQCGLVAYNSAGNNKCPGSEPVRHRQAARAQLVQAAGPIMCGQHAGPAYRYTNCNDENSFKACFHRTPATAQRAADDLQLTTPSTQLAGPAAMAKFVQFQDGQCLRTHRDTRSIQMAYLSSRQMASSGHNNNQGILSRNNQVPLRELNNTQQQQQQQHNGFYLPQNNAPAANFEGFGSGSFNNSYPANDLSFGQQRQSQLNPLCTTGVEHNQNNNNACQTGKDIDLMDCGEDEDAFNFKYDPKLIKSSSIETLCGAGEEREDPIMDDLGENCKSNVELMMSLQSCWLANQGQQQQHDILHPVQSFQTFEGSQPSQAPANETGDASVLSSLMKIDANQNQQLDHMKKKHDLDELTTALLAELTASLKAQVDLKNKRSGFGLHNSEKADNQQQQVSSSCSREQQQDGRQSSAEINPLELINEFDTLISNNR